MTLIGMPAKIDSSIAGRPASVPGILMKRLSRSALACSLAACLDRRVGVVGEQRRDLERDAAVDAVGALVDRLEEVGGARRSSRASSKKSAPRADSIPVRPVAQLGDLLVVGVAAGDRLVEDRRVGGEAGDRELVDVALQGAVVEHLAGDVVEPEALAEVVRASRSALISERSFRGFGHLLGGEAELGLQRPSSAPRRRRCASPILRRRSRRSDPSRASRPARPRRGGDAGGSTESR